MRFPGSGGFQEAEGFELRRFSSNRDLRGCRAAGVFKEWRFSRRKGFRNAEVFKMRGGLQRAEVFKQQRFSNTKNQNSGELWTSEVLELRMFLGR